jgi:hypothetical protein
MHAAMHPDVEQMTVSQKPAGPSVSFGRVDEFAMASGAEIARSHHGL